MTDTEKSLEERLKAARDEFNDDYHVNAPETPENESLSDGARAGIELVGGVLGGGLIGYGLDWVFGTSPILFLIFLILGVITAFYNIYKITTGLGTSVGFMRLHQGQKKAKQSPNLDEKD